MACDGRDSGSGTSTVTSQHTETEGTGTAAGAGSETSAGHERGTAAGAPVKVPPLHPSVDDYPTARLELRKGADGVVPVDLLVAATPQQRRHGLMEVEEFPDGVGMLFVFEEPRELGFWMKNTLVPLDLAAIAPSGRITDVVAMEPCPPDTDCPTYRPQGQAVAGLETPQGWLDEVGVGPGWTACVARGAGRDVLPCPGG